MVFFSDANTVTEKVVTFNEKMVVFQGSPAYAPQDIVPPLILSFFCEQTNYDVTSIDATVNCYMRFSDSSSATSDTNGVGVEYATASLVSPSFHQKISFYFSPLQGLSSGNMQAGTTVATAILPKGSESGVWKVGGDTTIADVEGNTRWYTLNDLDKNGESSTTITVTSLPDKAAPIISNLSCDDDHADVTEASKVRT